MCSVLIGSGRKPIMFENQMKKNSPARNGNQRWPLLVAEVAAGDVVAGQVVGDLDQHLDLVRLGRIRREIQSIVPIVSPLASTR